MSICLKYKNQEFIAEKILWDRDSYFIDFNNYWERLVACIAQKIAENTSTNWGEFNLIRTAAIKTLGIDPENKTCEFSGPVHILPVSIYHHILTSGLMHLIPQKPQVNLLNLIHELVKKALEESSGFIKSSIIFSNLEIIKAIGSSTKHILITNDSKKNNSLLTDNIPAIFSEVLTDINKEQLESRLTNESVFITRNSYLKDLYYSNGEKNILMADNINELSFTTITNKKIIVNIDGASRGNPGPSSIGIVFSEGDKTVIKEFFEFLGTHTNNHAEYTALIRALEISLENNYRDLEVKSDSELVVNQINKIYKVRDPDIKELYEKAVSLIKRLNSFNIFYIPREENSKADKLANLALKNNCS